MPDTRILSRSLIGLTVAVAAAANLSWQAKARSPGALGLKGHVETVCAVAFSPDGETLASASVDRTVKLWNVQTRTLKQMLTHEGKVRALAFSPDGKMLVSGGGENEERGGRAAILERYQERTGGVRCAATVALP
jgi:WD40 repeat protein